MICTILSSNKAAMFNLLKDYEGIIGIIVGLLTTIYLHYTQQKRKELSYVISDRYPLLTRSEELGGKFKIYFEGALVDNVYLLDIQFKNTGNVSIKAEDYERPVSIVLNKEAMILSAEVIVRKPATLKPTIEVHENRLNIAPILLNKDDRIALKIIVAGYTGNISFDYRIIDIVEIKDADKKRSASSKFFISFFILFIFGMFYDNIPDSWQPFKSIVQFVAGILAFLLPSLAIYSLYREGKRYPF